MIFFITSGFLESYNHYRTNDNRTVIASIKQKSKRLIPLAVLGIVGTLLSLALWLAVNKKFNLQIFFAVLTSILYLQCWIPAVYYYYAFSTVTWFLGVYFIIEFCSPWLLNCVSKIKNKKLLLVIVILIRVCWEVIIFFVFKGMIWEHYFSYIFPPLRLLDYLCGMIVGMFFKDRSEKIEHEKNVNSNILEFGALLSVFLFSFISSHVEHFKYGILFLVPSLFLIWIFSFEEGIISDFFKKSEIQKNGKDTKYYFVFHIVILHYTSYYIKNEIVGAMIAVIFLFFITSCYKRLESLVLKKLRLYNGVR